MSAVDLRRDLPGYSARRDRFDVLEIPPQRYLMIDGEGDPNTTPAYADAVSTLYPVAYALKAHSRQRHDRDVRVMPLEALWWADDPTVFTTRRDKSRWRWTVMILVAPWLDARDVTDAATTVAARGRGPRLADLHHDVLDEGLVVQTLHVGPYDDEGPVLATMHDEVIPARGLRMTGRHHEIYLGDPRRAAPERLRTILRQPVRRA
ncbi:GyrI-like domain-containing protein [uncultured Williamsia sp.]|uniref:GyrI-like domain-containing protein n=1 Tax=uncultured Williamsia sp. TaxID=259311 RepID=UPI00262C36FE|nr:GyrI-like domain-containing protein [uncultured Williamsia sp.]